MLRQKDARPNSYRRKVCVKCGIGPATKGFAVDHIYVGGLTE